jgi:dihydrofolate synthase/folylpolyglutamate synthase
VNEETETVDVYRNSSPYLHGVRLPLKGLYQQRNLPGVLKAIEVLNARGFVIPSASVVQGLENTVAQTHLKGRWQKLADEPLTICDTGHNVDGVYEVFYQVKLQKYNHLLIVWGAVKDKEIRDILAILPSHATYYFCQAKIPRALHAHELAALAADKGLKGTVIPDVNEAIARARSEAQKNDMIFIGGSTFVVAEINEL